MDTNDACVLIMNELERVRFLKKNLTAMCVVAMSFHGKVLNEKIRTAVNTRFEKLSEQEMQCVMSWESWRENCRVHVWHKGKSTKAQMYHSLYNFYNELCDVRVYNENTEMCDIKTFIIDENKRINGENWVQLITGEINYLSHLEEQLMNFNTPTKIFNAMNERTNLRADIKKIEEQITQVVPHYIDNVMKG